MEFNFWDKLIDISISKLIEKYEKKMDKSFENISYQLNRIEQKQERLLSSHLLSGISLLKKNYLDAAIIELIKADSICPYAANAKYWLGLAEYKKRNIASSKQYFKNALIENPFLSYKELNSVKMPKSEPVKNSFSIDLSALKMSFIGNKDFGDLSEAQLIDFTERSRIVHLG